MNIELEHLISENLFLEDKFIIGAKLCIASYASHPLRVSTVLGSLMHQCVSPHNSSVTVNPCPDVMIKEWRPRDIEHLVPGHLQ